MADCRHVKERIFAVKDVSGCALRFNPLPGWTFF
jgi:hypothetical protein